MVTTLINGQQVHCLIDTGSEVTTMEYYFYVQPFRAWTQLDPSWLSLKAVNNLPIMAEGITWVTVQIFEQVVEQVGLVVTCSPVVSSVSMVLGMNVLKDLDCPKCKQKWSSCVALIRGVTIR